MKLIRYSAAAAAILALATQANAQSAVDALQLNQPRFRGTARFMAMGGAFTALGGDLSTLTQNPGGIGIYRGSEIGLTLDLSFQKAKTDSPDGRSWSDTKTKFACNNFGYVGTAKLGSDVMKTFSWGVTYNRVSQFDRHLSGYDPHTGTSLTNYIASFTDGIDPDKLNFGESYNPYQSSGEDWLSILAYNSFMINPVAGTQNKYQGLYNNNTKGDAMLDVHERGYVDEYSFNFGGNISDVVYWGLGIGVTDLSYHRDVTYSESLENATVPADDKGSYTVPAGNAGFYLDNSKHISGSGYKFSFGLIVKPINEVRFGVAVHSPTYWSLTTTYRGWTDCSYLPNPSVDNTITSKEETDFADFDWRLRSPWRLMAGVALVLGRNAIVSVDYERLAYSDMHVRNAVYDDWGYDGYDTNDLVDGNIKTYTKAANIFRVGAEYRVTPQFSIRAGYNLQTSNVSKEAENNTVEVNTYDTDPSYTLDKATHNISVGIGYKFARNWYVDATYVYTGRKSTLHAYTNFDGHVAPQFDVTQSNSSAVISLGYKF